MGRYSSWLILFVLFFSGDCSSTKKYELCRRRLFETLHLNGETTSALLVSTTRDPLTSPCEILLKPERGAAVILSIRSYDLSPGDRLVIEDSELFRVQILGQREFLDEKKFLLSDGRISIHFTQQLNITRWKVNYELVATLAHERPCLRDDFQCDNGRCIDIDLQCDGHNNCGDRSDEKKCGRWSHEISVTKHSSTWAITLVAVGVILSVVVIVVLVVIFRSIAKKKEPSSVPTVTASIEPAPQSSYWPRFCSASSESAPDEQTCQVPSMYPEVPTAPVMDEDRRV